MADETDTTQEAQDTQPAQDAVDWRAKYEAMRQHSREWERRAKANDEAQAQLEKLRDESAKAQAELDEMRATAARQAAIASVADAANVPTEVVSMLNGSDADELLAQAKRLLKLMPVHPTRTDDGGGSATAKKTNAQLFAEALANAH